MPNSSICLSFDFDAMSVWFGYPNTTPAMLSRGEYGARVGVPRLLELLGRYQVAATFFIPGHTIDSFPEATAMILEAGHEVGHHSYAHVDPSQQTPDEERRDMERALEALRRIDVTPLGYRSPSADFSAATLGLIEEYGFLYDSSLMADDFRPYHPRLGDQVSQQSPLVRGPERACGSCRSASSSTTGSTSSSTSTPIAMAHRRPARCWKSGPPMWTGCTSMWTAAS